MEQPTSNFHGPFEIYFMVHLSSNSWTRTGFLLLKDGATINT